MHLSLAQILAEPGARRPQPTAVACGDGRVTYRDLREQACRYAALLHAHRAAAGSHRVAPVLANAAGPA